MNHSDFLVLGFNHTSFTVSQIESLKEYFCDILGFQLLSHAPRDKKTIQQITQVEGADIEVAFLQGPGHTIELIEYLEPEDKEKIVSRPCDAGFAHIALDVNDIFAAIKASKPFGFFPLGTPIVIGQGPNKGSRVAYLRNDDGVNIEFIEKQQ